MFCIVLAIYIPEEIADTIRFDVVSDRFDILFDLIFIAFPRYSLQRSMVSSEFKEIIITQRPGGFTFKVIKAQLGKLVRQT